MKFTQFISDLIIYKRCQNVSSLYESLGGKSKLAISLRTFRAVAAGQIPPSLNFFSSLFLLLPEHLKKDCMVSYFESSIGEKKERSALCSYLNKELNLSIKDDVESMWTKNAVRMFSEEQLKFLSSSTEVIRLYHRLIIYDGLSLDNCGGANKLDILKEFVRLKLAIKRGSIFYRVAHVYSLPHQDNSPKEMVAHASEFIFKHVDAFLAKEGISREQEVGYSFFSCNKRDAEKILDQMKLFKEWVKSFGLSEDRTDEVAFIWIDFARILMPERDF
jgi:hypothetical protein